MTKFFEISGVIAWLLVFIAAASIIIGDIGDYFTARYYAREKLKIYKKRNVQP